MKKIVSISFREALLIALAAIGPAVRAAELGLGAGSGLPGAAVIVPVALNSAGNAVAAQFDLSVDPAWLSLEGIARGSALAGQIADWEPLGSGRWRIVIYGTNSAGISSGDCLWLTFRVAAGAPAAAVPLILADAIVSRPLGQPAEPLDLFDGLVTILDARAAEFADLRVNEAGAFQMTFHALGGGRYALEHSTNLIDWFELRRDVTGGRVELIDSEMAGYRHRFFRMRQLP